MVDDSAVADFVGITGAAPHVAQYFLDLTGSDTMQAVGLFYDSPDLAASVPRPSSNTAPSAASGAHAEVNTVHGQPEEEDSEPDEDDEAMARRLQEDDEAMARRLQEEMYGSGESGSGLDADGVRAPIARRTETLVGPGADWGPEDMDESAVQQQMDRIRRRQQAGAGLFRQQRVPGSIWTDDPAARREALSQATAGASEQSSRQARLAEMYRAPYEIMNDMSWDHAKEEGKEKEKWILVNIQDSAVFDCQVMNRDIWKHEGIKETIKENFIFMQYDKNDPAAGQYLRLYFPRKDDIDAYPYVAIIDPRTGEQVKVWSGPPCPKPYDFLMQLHDFLDRYSLKVDAKNPVAKRKVEKAGTVDVGRMTEEQMLEHAMQASLQNGNGNLAPKEEDPDELTKSVGDVSKDKGKGIEEEEDTNMDESSISYPPMASPFPQISSTTPHVEPANERGVTGRIQFRHANGRIIRLFRLDDPVRRIYEWLKAEPLEGKEGQVFELKYNGADLTDHLGETIADIGLSGATVMIEYIEE